MAPTRPAASMTRLIGTVAAAPAAPPRTTARATGPIG